MTSLPNIRHSKATPEWFTPLPYIEAAREVLGSIRLDPASCHEANRFVQASYIFTKETDALKQGQWHGTVLLNPPGGLVNEFWKFLVEEWLLERVPAAVWIGFSLEQLQTLQRAKAPYTPLHFPICVPRSRIKFVESAESQERRRQEYRARCEEARATGKPVPKAPHDRPSHGNYVTYLGPEPARFRTIFSQFGMTGGPDGPDLSRTHPR